MKMQMLRIKVPVSQCIDEVLDYIFHSEMKGKKDETDSWYSTYESLKKLKKKVLNREGMH